MLLSLLPGLLRAPAAQGIAFAGCRQLSNLRNFRPLGLSQFSVQAAGEQLSFRVSFTEVEEVKQIKRRKPNAKQLRPRLDRYLAKRIPDVSRAQLQYGIKDGLVKLNGNVERNNNTVVRPGDIILCTLPPPPVTTAIPQDIPLDIVYEDEHLMVINKAAGMVVHPAPGNETGTLVNAVLHHCKLPEIELPPGQQLPKSLNNWPDPNAPDPAEIFDEDEDVDPRAHEFAAEEHLRPGIVHRLDKGTTGLMVVAKDAKTQWNLSDQFKDRTVQRTYYSVALRPMVGSKGIVETNIGRHPKDRKKMAAFPTHDRRGRWARSTYTLLETLGRQGSASLVQWNLSTGRTHQIRVHAQHVAHPLFGDETYGGTGSAAIHVLAKNKADKQQRARQLLQQLGRPALHAKTLGFVHPHTGAGMQFDSELPADFQAVLEGLRTL